MFEHGFPKHWSTLKKLIWLKGAGIIGGASAIWKTVTGTLIHITDALASPMQKCEVTLEPIQDLHGQDAPYPAGGGKNKIGWLVSGTQSVQGSGTVSFAKDTSTFTIDSNLTGGYGYRFGDKCKVTLAAGTYYLSSNLTGQSVGEGVFIYNTSTSSILARARSEGGASFTLSEQATVALGLNLHNPSSAGTYHFQLESGSTATAYSPYSNICPITGWTGCEVTRRGKNLYNPNAVTDNCYLSTTTGLPESEVGYVVSDYIPVMKNQGVIIPASGTARRWFYDKSKNPVTYLNNSSNQLFTPSDDGFIRVSVSKTSIFYNTYIIAYGSGSVPSEGLPTEYEPYNGTTLSVTFPDSAGTVYGGTHEFVSGNGNSKYASVDLGTLNYGYNATYKTFSAYKGDIKTHGMCISSQYKYGDGANAPDMTCCIGYTGWFVNNIVIKDSRYTDAASFKAAMSGVQLVYELETPITYQLTPQQIATLKGENNVWSNGDSVEITYKAQSS